MIIIKNRFTIPVNLEFRPTRRNIFNAMKKINSSIKVITLQGKTIDTLEEFPNDATQYTYIFKIYSTKVTNPKYIYPSR